jgi:hypothetical protein
MSKKKREFWPYAVVLVLATFMSGIVYAMSIMMSHKAPMVSEDYYVQELAYQEQIDKEQRMINDSRTPTVKVLKATSAVEITYAGFDASLNAIKGNVAFRRPSDPGQDFVLSVNPEADGKQWLNLGQVQKGLWQIQFDFEIDGRGYFHKENIEI